MYLVRYPGSHLSLPSPQGEVVDEFGLLMGIDAFTLIYLL